MRLVGVVVAVLQTTAALQLIPSAAPGAHPAWSRRCILAAAPLSALHWQTAAASADTTLQARSASAADTAAITDKVRLEFVEQVSAEEKRVLPMVIGLFGNNAPEAVGIFKQLCGGELRVPCPTDVDFQVSVPGTVAPSTPAEPLRAQRQRARESALRRALPLHRPARPALHAG